jgi:hypothetical protein
MNWLSRKKIYKYIQLTGLLALPIFLYFVPVSWLNEQHSICLFKNIFGRDCYGCGMTRAIISAIQLDFSTAYNYNKIFVVVLPLLIYIWIKTSVKLIYNN